VSTRERLVGRLCARARARVTRCCLTINGTRWPWRARLRKTHSSNAMPTCGAASMGGRPPTKTAREPAFPCSNSSCILAHSTRVVARPIQNCVFLGQMFKCTRVPQPCIQVMRKRFLARGCGCRAEHLCSNCSPWRFAGRSGRAHSRTFSSTAGGTTTPGATTCAADATIAKAMAVVTFHRPGRVDLQFECSH